jgi:Kef-type K+ transport system membrane component KefB/voltage-gated potassium channel Kch
MIFDCLTTWTKSGYYVDILRIGWRIRILTTSFFPSQLCRYKHQPRKNNDVEFILIITLSTKPISQNSSHDEDMRPSRIQKFYILLISLCCHHAKAFSPRTPSTLTLSTPLWTRARHSHLSMIPDTSPELLQSFTSITTAAQEADIDALGRDIFTFLLVSVAVVPLSKSLKISPVLGFLAVGCLLGPFGLQVFSNMEADLQLGDFGILFLLFNEGLSLSPERIKELGRFTGLGVFQLLISIAMIFIASFWGGPVVIKYSQEIGLPLDTTLLRPVFDNPVQSFCIAAAGALSSSAFVLPIIKQKNWERRPEGVSGLSILLLQDLAVAPLLVILPLLAGSGPSSSIDLGVLVAKATFGFGAVLVAGSYLLSYVFEFVAQARSTETFVAAALLVAVGMGQAADSLGLSASTGAFAAGVLLAGNRYRAQIQADIKPFEGILLGIFFITAGAGLDPATVLREWPTLFSGILVFIALKAGIIFASGPTLGLTRGQAARVAFTLAGGGEFALVLFKLAEDLEVLPTELAKLLTASVIISMALTPLLGEIGNYAGNKLEAMFDEVRDDGLTPSQEAELFDQIDVDNSGSIEIDELRNALLKLGFPYVSIAEVFTRFDLDGDGLIDREEWKTGIEAGLLVDALGVNSQDALSKTDITFSKDALIICGYGEVGKSLFSLLNTSGGTGAANGGVVCFDLNPSRVTSGVLSGAPVVFGDGAKLDLLKAAGVTEPRAVIISLKNNERRLGAVERLRSFLPQGTPIYVYGGNSGSGQDLLDAGATEVIYDNIETILRFASLVGVCKSLEDVSLLRDRTLQSTNTILRSAQEEMAIPGLSEDAMIDLIEELGCVREDILESWSVFEGVSFGRDTVPIPELKEMVMRRASDGPSDTEVLSKCLALDNQNEAGELTFLEFLRATFVDCGC